MIELAADAMGIRIGVRKVGLARTEILWVDTRLGGMRSEPCSSANDSEMPASDEAGSDSESITDSLIGAGTTCEHGSKSSVMLVARR